MHNDQAHTLDGGAAPLFQIAHHWPAAGDAASGQAGPVIPLHEESDHNHEEGRAAQRKEKEETLPLN